MGALFTLYQHVFGLGCEVGAGFGLAGAMVRLRQELSVAQLQVCQELSMCVINHADR